MSRFRRVAFAARVFTLSALAGVGGLLGGDFLRGVGAVAVVALAAQLLSGARRLPETAVAALEGAAVALLSVTTAPGNDSVAPYLGIPLLIGGLASRLPGVLAVLLAELTALAVGFQLAGEHLTREVAAREMMWLVTGFGLGFLGASIQRLLSESTSVVSYRGAVDLIKQLHRVSGRLAEGLDVPAIADGLLNEAGQVLPLRSAALFASTSQGAVSPLRYAPGTAPVDLADSMSRAERAWWSRSPQQEDGYFALPLIRDSQVVAVLVGESDRRADTRRLEDLCQRLEPETLKLHAALLFAEIRRHATEEERHRLAREVHDGIAQDVASLGYVLDTIAPGSAEQQSQLEAVRSEVSRVVGELRHSVFDLRTDVGAGRGLGESLATLAQHIAARSSMAVHVSLDEAPSRLGREEESQLLRIAQEAMNNARKHSAAENLWLTCRVFPPHAEIEVRDDGTGLGTARDDSHGLQIMRERAERIGAELQIRSPAKDGGGTSVCVRLSGNVR